MALDFEMITFVAVVVTGVIWLYDRLIGQKRRKPQAKEPKLVEYAKSFFPVLLVVFLLRSFLAEPFKIPSGSMIPTLLIGDYIVVNKFTYGIRLPIIHSKVISVHEPQHGDVMVFRYPPDPSIDYIKRVIGLPGDTVTYRNKVLSVNGQPVPEKFEGPYVDAEPGQPAIMAGRYQENFLGRVHDILIQPNQPTLYLKDVLNFPSVNNCTYYGDNGFSCVVPPGQYFMMGDNRDNSSDSRYWGFVPDQNIVGKAELIWWDFGHLKRIGMRVR